MEAEHFQSINHSQHTKEEIISDMHFCSRTSRIRQLKNRSWKSQKFALEMNNVSTREKKRQLTLCLESSSAWTKHSNDKQTQGISAQTHHSSTSRTNCPLRHIWRFFALPCFGNANILVSGRNSLQPCPDNTAISSQHHCIGITLIFCQIERAEPTELDQCQHTDPCSVLLSPTPNS